MIEDFYGNERVVRALEIMLAQQRIPQTLLLVGPEGIGKATLARRLAAYLLGGKEEIERDDLSLPQNLAMMGEREKWSAEQRAEDPLLLASHPDFVTFPPDGPLRQISIQQMRLLKELAQFKPLKGDRRVFLVDKIDRAGEQAANSLLKTLEEPPDHLMLILTAQNIYDLLPTIRSRAVPLYLVPLQPQEMRSFVASRHLDEPERRIALAGGCPGIAISLDLEAYERRREAMLALLKVSAGVAPFGHWLQYSDSLGGGRQDKRLDDFLLVLYSLLADILAAHQHRDEIRNVDIRDELEQLARQVSFDWIRKAVAITDELFGLLRRNIQKSIALDAFAIELRGMS